MMKSLPMPDTNSVEAEESRTILVVDDEPTLVSLVRTMLWRAGFTVLEAHSGAEALRINTEASRIDLLLTDIVMPEMNGCDLAANLQQSRPELKVLFMSGYRDRVIFENTGISVDESLLVRKPFTQYTLVSRIGEMLAGAGLHA